MIFYFANFSGVPAVHGAGVQRVCRARQRGGAAVWNTGVRGGRHWHSEMVEGEYPGGIGGDSHRRKVSENLTLLVNTGGGSRATGQ